MERILENERSKFTPIQARFLALSGCFKRLVIAWFLTQLVSIAGPREAGLSKRLSTIHSALRSPFLPIQRSEEIIQLLDIYIYIYN